MQIRLPIPASITGPVSAIWTDRPTAIRDYGLLCLVLAAVLLLSAVRAMKRLIGPIGALVHLAAAGALTIVALGAALLLLAAGGLIAR